MKKHAEVMNTFMHCTNHSRKMKEAKKVKDEVEFQNYLLKFKLKVEKKDLCLGKNDNKHPIEGYIKKQKSQYDF